MQESRPGKPPQNQRLPEIYYRRRRAAAGVIIVVLVLIAAIVLSRCGSSDETTPTGNETEQTTTTSEATTSETSEEATSEEETSEAVESSEAVPAEEAPSEAATTTLAEGVCDPATLELVASSSASTYTNPERPTFYVTLRNNSDVDCVVDLETTPLVFTVFDLVDDTRIWGDTDCNAPVAQGQIELAAGQERYYQAIWSRTSSAPEQCAERTPAEAGSYYLTVSLGDDRSAPHTFNLA